MEPWLPWVDLPSSVLPSDKGNQRVEESAADVQHWLAPGPIQTVNPNHILPWVDLSLPRTEPDAFARSASPLLQAVQLKASLNAFRNQHAGYAVLQAFTPIDDSLRQFEKPLTAVIKKEWLDKYAADLTRLQRLRANWRKYPTYSLRRSYDLMAETVEIERIRAQLKRNAGWHHEAITHVSDTALKRREQLLLNGTPISALQTPRASQAYQALPRTLAELAARRKAGKKALTLLRWDNNVSTFTHANDSSYYPYMPNDCLDSDWADAIRKTGSLFEGTLRIYQQEMGQIQLKSKDLSRCNFVTPLVSRRPIDGDFKEASTVLLQSNQDHNGAMAWARDTYRFTSVMGFARGQRRKELQINTFDSIKAMETTLRPLMERLKEGQALTVVLAAHGNVHWTFEPTGQPGKYKRQTLKYTTTQGALHEGLVDNHRSVITVDQKGKIMFGRITSEEVKDLINRLIQDQRDGKDKTGKKTRRPKDVGVNIIIFSCNGGGFSAQANPSQALLPRPTST